MYLREFSYISGMLFVVLLNIVIVIYREATRTISNLYHGGVRKNRNKMLGDPSSNQKCFSLLLDGYSWVCYGSGKDSLGDMQTERIRENIL